MTTAKLIEHRIARRLLQRREQGRECARTTAAGETPNAQLQSALQQWADRLIAILAVTAGLLVVGSYLEELLWAVLAAATVFTLRE